MKIIIKKDNYYNEYLEFHFSVQPSESRIIANNQDPEYPADVPCPDVLCKGLKVGTMFRFSDAKPRYFVTCTNSGSVCRKCKKPLVFDTRNTACVNDIVGSKLER